MLRLGRQLLAAALLLLGLPAAAHAGTTTFGSDLSAPANMVEAHGADSAFWNIRLANGTSPAVPADGQITEIKVKGTVLDNPNQSAPDPITMIHFQVLRPQPDGSVRVILSSGDFYTPLGGDPQQVSTYHPINLCVQRGDYVDFNDIGGSEWWWHPYPGMPFQVFSRVQGSATNFYTADNGTNVGTQWHPQATHDGQELLMQTKLATGPDATDICPGGYMQHIFSGLDVTSPQTAMLKTRTNKVLVRVSCHGANYGGCHGTTTVRARIGEQDVELGQVRFAVPSTHIHYLELPVDPVATRLIQALGSVRATATSEAHDNPRNDTRADPAVPVQHRTTTASFTIKADRPIMDCVVPNVKRKSIASAKKKLLRANCKLGKVTRKKSKASYVGRVLTTKPKTGTVLPQSTRIRLVVGQRQRSRR